MDDEGYERRLRAVVQNRLLDFSETLADRGMQRKIIDDDKNIEPDEAQIHRSAFVDEVQQRMRRSRGRELPGTFNPLIIGDLFYLQSKPWQSIVEECIDWLLEDVQKTVIPILQDVLDEKSLTGVLEHIVNPSLDKIEASLRLKTKELLKPQQLGHPITCNHYFTESVQKAREEHLRNSIAEKLKDFFGANYITKYGSSEFSYTFKMDSLIDVLGTQTEGDVEHFACSEAIDYMQAYYKVF
jgi:hypothetical protein